MVVEDKIVDGFKVKVASIGDLLIGAAYEIGPRILYLASGKKPELNLFGILPNVGVQTSEGFWRIYGGHRLWSSPEAKPRSYSLDDKPVRVEFNADTLTVYGNPEENNCIQKEIIIKANPSGGVQVIHRIRNIGRWPITLACWALSVMRKGGFAIIPIKPSKVDEEGLLPDRHVSLWPYTDLTDKRLSFTNEYVFIKQDPNVEKPVKIGANANPEWTAYWVNGMIFMKQFHKEAGEYPDFDCNVEVYTNSAMLELETLGPLKTINPSESIQHVEVWKVFEAGEVRMTAEDIRDKIEPLLK
ncbi:MAG: hypothetical protein QXR06_00160 [Candidatus Bathyarchaeia archaeon]|nr:hypothetical protein [Candidatus Bathyarchaeota archaeon]